MALVEMTSMSQTTLEKIVKLPPIWEKWNEVDLFKILGPDDCDTLQLLLHKKIDQITLFYEHQLAKAAIREKEAHLQRQKQHLYQQEGQHY